MGNTFDGLGLSDTLNAAVAKLGFTEPMPVQAQAVPRILAGENLAVEAPTGTGKTLAYLLPILQQVNLALPAVQAVILAPTYELAMQIAGEIDRLRQAGAPAVRSQGLIGGANIARQIEKLKAKPQVVAGSAGRIVELARKGKLKLAQVHCLVLDEFDRLLDDQNQATVAELVKLLPKQHQTLLFSATAPKKALERADQLAQPQLLRVAEGPVKLPAELENFYMMVPFRDKAEAVRKLARTLPVKRGLVFVNRTFDAQRTLAKLQYDGIQAVSLLGTDDKMARKNAIAAFRSGKVQLLLATDLAARGLDIAGIDYVFNLDLPETAAVYQHRAGRTARAGASGRVVTLADLKEALKLAGLEQSLGVKLKPLEHPAGASRPAKPAHRRAPKYGKK